MLVIKLDDDVLDALTKVVEVGVVTDTTAVVEEEKLSLLVVGVFVDGTSELLVEEGLGVVLTSSLEVDESGVLLD